MEITEKQKRQILATAEIIENGDIAVLKKLLEVEDFIETEKEEIVSIKEEMVNKQKEIDTKVDEKLQLVDQKISEIKNGEDYVLNEEDLVNIASRVKVPVVEKIIEKTEKIIEQPIVKNEIVKETVEVAKYEPGEEIVSKINELSTDEDEYLIDKSHIKGIKEIEKDITELKKRGAGINAGIVGRDVFKDIDLSSQLDGVTKTFNIMAVWNIINVSLSSYPYGALRKGIDYTWTPTSITFTNEIDATTQLSVGQKCILTVVTS